MKFKNIKDFLFFYLSVPKCVGCKRRLLRTEKALCADCLSEHENLLLRNCSICSLPLNRCSCSNKYLDLHYVHKVIKVFRYLNTDEVVPSNNLIYSLKRDNRQDVLEFVAEALCDAIEHSLKSPSECVFVNVPRRRKERARYGIDHSELLAKYIAKRFSAEYYQPLIPKSKKAQKKTQARERLENAKFELRKNAKRLDGKTVVIVDDVITTGASMGACSVLLHSLAAKKIVGAALAIAYKDSYIPFSTDDRFFNMKK